MRCNNAVQKSPVAWEAFELGKRAGLFFASYYVAIEALKGQRAAKGQAQPTHGSVMAASIEWAEGFMEKIDDNVRMKGH